jgi:hypothetical protein
VSAALVEVECVVCCSLLLLSVQKHRVSREVETRVWDGTETKANAVKMEEDGRILTSQKKKSSKE